MRADGKEPPPPRSRPRTSVERALVVVRFANLCALEAIVDVMSVRRLGRRTRSCGGQHRCACILLVLVAVTVKAFGREPWGRYFWVSQAHAGLGAIMHHNASCPLFVRSVGWLPHAVVTLFSGFWDVSATLLPRRCTRAGYRIRGLRAMDGCSRCGEVDETYSCVIRAASQALLVVLDGWGTRHACSAPSWSHSTRPQH